MRGYFLDLAPSLCYLAVIVLAGGVLLGHEGLLTDAWMIPVVATLLGTATGNAWHLLLAVGAAQAASDVSAGTELTPGHPPESVRRE